MFVGRVGIEGFLFKFINFVLVGFGGSGGGR